MENSHRNSKSNLPPNASGKQMVIQTGPSKPPRAGLGLLSPPRNQRLGNQNLGGQEVVKMPNG